MKAKEELAVFGAGGHAKSVIDIIEQQGNHAIGGLLDHDRIIVATGLTVIRDVTGAARVCASPARALD